MENTYQANTKVSFLKALFDFKFEQFIYVRVARFIYALLVILVLVAVAFLMIAALIASGSGNASASIALLGLIGGPLAGILSIIILRLSFESGIALIVIAENTKK